MVTRTIRVGMGYQTATGSRHGAWRGWFIAMVTISLLAYGDHSGQATESNHAPKAQTQTAADSVDIQMKNVNFRLAHDVVLEVRTLRGQLQRTKPEIPVTFDDSDSFTVQIDSAQVAIAPASLTTLLNSYVLANRGSPLKNVAVMIDGDRLIQKGTIHKKVDLPFEIVGSVSATKDGRIRIHADKIRSAHVPIKGLLHFLGEDLAKLANQATGSGMEIVGDDIILIPRMLTPAPHLEGRVTQVSIAGGKIVQFFDSGRGRTVLSPPVRSSAYIYHRGGVLRFGKLTMNDADLEIVGDRPGAFEFFQREYLRQLVAGYSKTTSSKGLVAHMADYSRVRPDAVPNQGRSDRHEVYK